MKRQCVKITALALAFARGSSMPCSDPHSYAWGEASTLPLSFEVTTIDVDAQTAGGLPVLQMRPVLDTNSSYFDVPAQLYRSVNGWVTAVPPDEEWPWAAAHPGCRWDLDHTLSTALRSFGSGTADCDAAVSDWSTANNAHGVPATTYRFKTEVVMCFTELDVDACDDAVYLHGNAAETWEAPAYDFDNTWVSTWWAQVLPSHTHLSVCRRLWQSNVLTVTAQLNVSNTVPLITAFGDGTVVVDAVEGDTHHNQITPSSAIGLQLTEAHFSLTGERWVSDETYEPLEINADEHFVMQFEDRHRFTFALSGGDVVDAVRERYTRLNAEYYWMVPDHADAGMWIDASERYTVRPYTYARVRDGSLVQVVNTNAGTTAVRTDRASTNVVSFVVEDSIDTSGTYIEDQLQLRVMLTWSVDYCKELAESKGADGPMWCAAVVECEWRNNTCQYNYDDCVALSPRYTGQTDAQAEAACDERPHCAWWSTCSLCGNTCDVNNDCPKDGSVCLDFQVAGDPPCGTGASTGVGCSCSGGSHPENLCPESGVCPCLSHPDHERRLHEHVATAESATVTLLITFDTRSKSQWDWVLGTLAVVFGVAVIVLAALQKSESVGYGRLY